MRHFNYLLLAVLVIAIASCNRPIRYDLIVENASIFDTKTGEVSTGKTILVNDDIIVGIINSNEPVRTKKVVDADGRLVIPGLIDTHVSFEKAIFSTNKNADNHPKILTNFYRSRFSRNYMPYGITTAIDMGTDSLWLNQISQWQPNPKFTDLLVSYNSNYLSSTSSNAFLSKVQATMDSLSVKGIKYLYIDNCQDLQKNELLKQTAEQKNITIFEKSDCLPGDIKESKNIENIISPVLYFFNKYGDKTLVNKQIENVYGKIVLPQELYALEVFKYIVENNPALLDTIVSSLKNTQVSISTNLHSMAEYCDQTHFNIVDKDRMQLTKELKHRAEYSFNHLLSFVSKLHANGITLRIGTNSKKAGIAFISEQMLLADAGIPVAEIIKISTINGAKTLGIDKNYGSVEIGKKADLIIYDQNPLEDPKNFASPRRVIKSGKYFKRNDKRFELEE